MTQSNLAYKATKDKQTSRAEDQHALFIGRWQPWHKGHQWLIDQQLNRGNKVCVAIRDVTQDEQNPFTAERIKSDLENIYLKDLVAAGRVKVIIIPDISSVNYGRGVGYDIIEHTPPEDISNISATKIRAELKAKNLI